MLVAVDAVTLGLTPEAQLGHASWRIPMWLNSGLQDRVAASAVDEGLVTKPHGGLETLLSQAGLTTKTIKSHGEPTTSHTESLSVLIAANSQEKCFKRGRDYLDYCVRVQPIVMGKAWQRTCEETGHVASTVREQREVDAGAQLTVSFALSLDPQPMDEAAHS